MWYITYDTNTHKIIRMDSNKIIIENENYKCLEGDIDDDVFTRMYIYRITDNGEFYIDEQSIPEYELNILREKRAPLLKAFDIYKSNLLVGALVISEEEQQEVITWYNLILDLDEDAINNPPEIILRYVQN